MIDVGFQLEFPVEGLTGAAYNPRAIDDDALEVLQRSIEAVGFAKPIIVTQAGLIVAGHQRTKAARAMGLVTVPAFVLADINTYDEVRFNQLHNGTDMDKIDKPVRVPAAPATLGFAEVHPMDIDGNLRSEGAWIRSEINRLLLRYGNWGCAVVTQSGVVISSPQYLLSCKAMKLPARVYYTPDEAMVTAAGFFHRQYGRFSYSHLKRTPWIQTFAQPFRLRAPAESARSKALLESVLYMQVMDSGSSEGKPIRPGPNPHITKDDRILDFGCGQGDYVKLLLSMGYNIRGMEFFRRAGNMLDTGAVRRMCDAIARDIRKNGLYDVVICDSVVNSVDTLEAEADVVTCLNAFTKPGHKIFFSGRQVEGIEQKGRATRAALAGQRGVEFFDENGFSGLFREGTWFYQKFHTKVQANALCAKYLGEPHYGCHSPGWQIATTKTVGLTVEQRADSIRREFNLPWPDGESVGKGDEMVAAWREAIVISGSD